MQNTKRVWHNGETSSLKYESLYRWSSGLVSLSNGFAQHQHSTTKNLVCNKKNLSAIII